MAYGESDKRVQCSYRDHALLAASHQFEYSRRNEEQMPFFEALCNRIGLTICLDDSLNHNIQIRLVWKEHQRKRA